MKGPPLPPLKFETLGGMLRAAAACDGCGLTFVDAKEHEQWLSWSDLLARARSAAATLLALGLRRGERVVIALPTSQGFVETFFGALLAGAVPAPIGPPGRLGVDEYELNAARMIEAAGARLVIADARGREPLGRAAAHGRAGLGCVTAEDLGKERHGEADEPVAADDLALVQFSSGSTVAPKPIALSHRQVVSQCTALTALMPARDGVPQVGVSWLPLYHDMGLIGPLLTAVCYGRYRMALMRPEHFLVRPALWLRAIARHRAELSAAPNFAYALCLTRVTDDDLAGADLSCWRYALNGSEPVSMEVLRQFGERFSRWGFNPNALMPVYGLAEATLAVTFTSADEPVRGVELDHRVLATTGAVVPGEMPVVAVGRPVPGCEVRIHDQSGRDLPERQTGTIMARSESMMMGYYGDSATTQRVLRAGWLDTGDLGFIDGGELFICGRAKDVVIIRGATHTSESLEACLHRIEGIRPGSVAALGFTPASGGCEELLVLVERSPRASPLQDASIVAQVRSALLAHTGVRPGAVHMLPLGGLPLYLER